MIELRWVEKVGLGVTEINKVETVKTKVLQYRKQVGASLIQGEGGIEGMERKWSEWIDVPTVTEG